MILYLPKEFRQSCQLRNFPQHREKFQKIEIHQKKKNVGHADRKKQQRLERTMYDFVSISFNRNETFLLETYLCCALPLFMSQPE